jgi:hypothetical protein
MGRAVLGGVWTDVTEADGSVTQHRVFLVADTDTGGVRATLDSTADVVQSEPAADEGTEQTPKGWKP